MDLSEALPAPRHPGGAVHGVYTMSGHVGYARSDDGKIPQHNPEMDSDIEDQLISRAIDVLFWEHPELVKTKKLKRYHVNMILGKITSGDIKNAIDANKFIKALKRKNIRVE